MQEIAVHRQEEFTAEPMPAGEAGIDCLMYGFYDSLGPSDSEGDEDLLLA